MITPFQSGFKRGDSTVNQLVDLYNTFCHALDEGKEVRVVFCDISKAFDRVWYQGLLAKLYHYGITGNLYKWFDSYLSIVNHQDVGCFAMRKRVFGYMRAAKAQIRLRIRAV